ncbi:tetraacyldisaccharide 4'-kinase [Candidatus Sumerlaeota bacterium]|nr:tetraacyldisaccharide 4'-kinase [Candidatus Sumerlaeota bacterium]
MTLCLRVLTVKLAAMQELDSTWMRLLWPVRAAAVPLYYAGYRWSRRTYDRGGGVRLDAPVICVGNLTVGGSGKTPATIALAQMLLEQGRKPAVLSRGYKRAANSAAPTVVAAGDEICCGVEQAGDEPLLIAREAPGVAVVAHPNRAEAGRLALEQLGCDTLLLDDGFQHWALRRDANIVCVDANLPLSRARLLPLGPYREPLSALQRADAVLLTQSSDARLLSERREELRALPGLKRETPVWEAIAQPVELRSIQPEQSAPELAALNGAKIVAACAIARPEYFRRTLLELGADVAELVSLPDHARWDPAAVERIEALARRHRAGMILITAKDRVKMEERLEFASPWFSLESRIQWPEEQKYEIRRFLNQAIDAFSSQT